MDSKLQDFCMMIRENTENGHKPNINCKGGDKMWRIPKPPGIERREDSPSGWDTFNSLLDKYGRDNSGRNTAKTIAECIIDVDEKYWKEIDMFCFSYSISERKASEQYLKELRAAVNTWGYV